MSGRALSYGTPLTLSLSPPGLRCCPAVGIEDVDGGGDPVEDDGTHLSLPTPGSPHMLVVPGASPR